MFSCASIERPSPEPEPIYNLTIVADEIIRLTQESSELRHYLRETATLLAGAVGTDLGDLCWPEFAEQEVTA